MVNTLGTLTAIVLAFSAFVAWKNSKVFEQTVSEIEIKEGDKKNELENLYGSGFPNQGA
jgi:hypothetical protein